MSHKPFLPIVGVYLLHTKIHNHWNHSLCTCRGILLKCQTIYITLRKGI